jgi:hypothetical protein
MSASVPQLQKQRSAPQARFWRESETTEARNDHVAHSTGRIGQNPIADKRGPTNTAQAWLQWATAPHETPDVSNINTTISRTIVSIILTAQRNIHDVSIGAKVAAQLRQTKSIAH